MVSARPSSASRFASAFPGSARLSLLDPTPFETDWETWTQKFCREYLCNPDTGEYGGFAPFHREFMDWVWALEKDKPATPLVAIWPRGAAKSTLDEIAAVLAGAMGKRMYILYVSETLSRAEDHVANVASILEKQQMEAYYPNVGSRMIDKYGASEGYNRVRLRTASGYTVDAVGMDVAARGAKLEHMRPDMMIFDDIDGDSDDQAVIQRKIWMLTHKFLPAGTRSTAVLLTQNLIHSESIFSMLAGVAPLEADFLTNRIVSGPHPAVEGLEYTQEEVDGRFVYKITGGRALWQGMDLATCEHLINSEGISAFLTERQQEVEQKRGEMFGHVVFRRCAPSEVPLLVRREVWVDPAVTSGDKSDSHGVQIDGMGIDGIIYRLYSWEQRATPEKALCIAITKAVEYGATSVGIEIDQGGEMWNIVFKTVLDACRGDGMLIDGILYRVPSGTMLQYKFVRAGAGLGSKADRASKMLPDYELGRIVHVIGTHLVLEKALNRFLERKPFDLVDACLVGNTMVRTDCGDVAIRSIRAGMRVLTRSGWRCVRWSEQTGRNVPVVRVELENGASLIGTPSHPILTSEQGWTAIEDSLGLTATVASGMMPVVNSREDLRWTRGLMLQRVFPIEGASIAGIPMRSRELIGRITRPPEKAHAAWRNFIARCGLIFMGRSRQGRTFTTETGIPATTILQTLSASPSKSIAASTAIPTGEVRRKDSSIWSLFESRQRSGTHHRKGSRGIASTEEKHGTAPWSASVPALGADNRFNRARMRLQSTAGERVRCMGLWLIPRALKSEDVSNAGRPFQFQSTGAADFAGSRVRAISAMGRADVYNLSVEDCEEYVANGILVHNCAHSWRAIRRRGRLSGDRTAVAPLPENVRKFAVR